MFKIINGTEIALSEEEISSYNAEEAALQKDLIRNQRNTLLSQSDVYALADRITDEWRTYRQALRDVPAQAGFPDNITWPTKPT
jgi:hypothetical protein|tara:strand:+ start:4213 stop:4464 length:252 start_codon:yes stop_codon:yes gene_type:complete